MAFHLSAIVLLLAITGVLAYTVYKLIWYRVNMAKLQKALRAFSCVKRLDKDTFLIEGEQRYRVVLLSFVSVHGRWILEKRAGGLFAQVRKRSFFAYPEFTSAPEPEHAKEYRREFRFMKKKRVLPALQKGEQGILLLYPTPKKVFFADKEYQQVQSGFMIDGYEVLFAEDLWERIQ